MSCSEHPDIRCIYCHTTVVESASLVVCERCEAPHHAECWVDNGGCARTGCVPETLQTSQLPVAAPAVATAPIEPPAGATAKARASRQTIAVLVGSAVILMAAIVAVVVVALAGDAGPRPAPATAQPVAATLPPVATTPTMPGDEPQSRAERLGDPDVATRSSVRLNIRRLLIRQHTAAADGDWDTAFRLLTRRKRRDKEAAAGGPGDAAAGAAEYERLIAPLVQGLVPEELRVDDVELDGNEATVHIRVPYGDGACYAGTTWVRFEHGIGWRFDPGYEGRQERRGASPLARRSQRC